MRVVVSPIDDPLAVYQTCINSISDQNLRSRLQLVATAISSAANDYELKAHAKQLYLIVPNSCENDDLALGSVTKRELKSVYSSHMVGKKKPARALYDLLLSRAPLGKCPFCGFGHATTLDHYLPKTLYPQLSVLPLNLLPSCKDCNTGKSTAIATTGESQTLHPYFDHHNFINEQWLYAEVMQTVPVTINFFVRAPVHWSNLSKARVQAHFDDFKLASRYSVEASNELACLRDSLQSYQVLLGLNGVKQNLLIEAQSYANQHSNSWQTAMFQALSNSDWYCEGGFL